MTKRPTPTGAGKSASEREARTKDIRVMASRLAMGNIGSNMTGDTDEAGVGRLLRGTQNEYESVTFGEDEHR